MKKFLFGFALLALLGGSAVVAQTVSTKGLHFVAPTTNGTPESTVASPEMGEIVFDAVNSIFKGFNGSTWSSLDSSVSTVPSGTISAFVGTTAPAGYVFCDGSSYSATTYANLAQVLWDSSTSNYAFGGSGTFPSGSFNVPDLRGVFLRGLSGASSNDPDKTTRTASASGGNSGNNIGSLQADQVGPHTHNLQLWAQPTGGGNGAPQAAASQAGGTATTASNGTSETRPKNVYVNYIIKL